MFSVLFVESEIIAEGVILSSGHRAGNAYGETPEN